MYSNLITLKTYFESRLVYDQKLQHGAGKGLIFCKIPVCYVQVLKAVQSFKCFLKL